MKNQVKEILNRETVLQNKLKAVVEEKEQLAINVLADANALVKELGCAHLLNTSTESIVNIAINKGRIVEIAREAAANITINKGKVVKVVKEVEVKVEDTTRINKLTAEIEELKLETSWQKDLIVALENKQDEYKKVIKEYEFEKEMSEAQMNSTINKLVDDAVRTAKEENAALKKKVKALETIVNTPDIDEATNAELAAQVERFKKSSSSFQSRATKAESEVARLNTVIDELKAQIAKLEKAANNTIVNTTIEVEEELTDEYLEHLAGQEESIMAGIRKENKEEKKEEVKENTVTGPKYVKLVSSKLGKGGRAKLFLTESCYLIASDSAKEITWITKSPISDEYKKQVEDILVKQYKFNKTRVEVSPIIVQNEVGYMARVRGAEGLDTYSNDDVYSGYVLYGDKFILYTYFPNTNTAIIEDLGKKVKEAQGKLSGNTMPTDGATLNFANKEIRKMFKKYQALTADIRKKHEENVETAKNELATNQEIADKIQEERRAKVLAAAANNPELAAQIKNEIRIEGDDNNTVEETTVTESKESILDSSFDNDSYQDLMDEFGAF